MSVRAEAVSTYDDDDQAGVLTRHSELPDQNAVLPAVDLMAPNLSRGCIAVRMRKLYAMAIAALKSAGLLEQMT